MTRVDNDNDIEMISKMITVKYVIDKRGIVHLFVY